MMSSRWPRIVGPGARTAQGGCVGAADEAVDQHGDVVDGQAGGGDAAEGFLEGVGAPDLAAGGLEPGERGGLVVGEALGRLSSAQRASLKRRAASWSPSRRSWFQ